MIDAFVKVWAESPMRSCLAGAVIDRLLRYEREGQARVFVLAADHHGLFPAIYIGAPVYISLLPDRFWITSKEYADRRAESPIYVVIDDDHLPIGKDWLEKGVAALAARPDFAMLSSWSVNGEVPLNNASSYDEDVFEHFAIGTPYFCRRGSLGQLPDGPLESYDQVLSEHVKKIGRIGFLRSVRHNHLGYGYSQVIPEHWGA